MALYHFVTLDPLALDGAPIALPALFANLDKISLADLSWTAPDFDNAYVGRGLWPVVEHHEPPGVGERNAAAPSYAPDAESRRVIASYGVEPMPAPSNPVLTRLEFRRLFTFLERNAFDNAAMSETLTPEQLAVLRTFEVDFNAAQEISLLDPDTIDALGFFAYVGLLTPERAAEILAYRK